MAESNMELRRIYKIVTGSPASSAILTQSRAQVEGELLRHFGLTPDVIAAPAASKGTPLRPFGQSDIDYFLRLDPTRRKEHAIEFFVTLAEQGYLTTVPHKAL